MHLALECLATSGHLRLRVTGASMLPEIQPGSYVLIRRTLPAEMTPGDVVLARTENGVRLHRLVTIQGRGDEKRWITRGDNHEKCDPPLASEQLLGVLTRIEESGRMSWFSRLRAAATRRLSIA